MKAGRALRAIRLFYGQSLSEAALNLRYAKSFISDLENDRKSPSMETLERYGEAFDIPVSSIMLLAESETSNPSSLKAKVRVAVSRKVLGVLELMGARDHDA